MTYLKCVTIILNYNESMNQLVCKTEAVFLALRNSNIGGTLYMKLLSGWVKIVNHSYQHLSPISVHSLRCLG